MKPIRKLKIISILAAALILAAGAAHAEQFPEISAKELKAKMDAGQKLTLINTLSDIEFKENHIPGSIHIPMQEILTTDKLPADKNQLIVTYCMGRKWVISTKAAGLVAKRRYKNIMVFRDGIPGWKKAGYPLKTLYTLKSSEVPSVSPKKLNAMRDTAYLIDVRPEHLYTKGYIPESRAIPLGFLSMFHSEIPKDEKIVIIDHAGKQARTAAKFLKSEGFQDVSWMSGGLTTYVKQGFEIVK